MIAPYYDSASRIDVFCNVILEILSGCFSGQLSIRKVQIVRGANHQII